MNKPNTFFSIAGKALLLLCFTAVYLPGKAQDAAKPQPLKKANTVAATNSSSNTTPAPWEVQRIQPTKDKQALKVKPNTKPEEAQPIQHK